MYTVLQIVCTEWPYSSTTTARVSRLIKHVVLHITICKHLTSRLGLCLSNCCKLTRAWRVMRCDTMLQQRWQFNWLLVSPGPIRDQWDGLWLCTREKICFESENPLPYNMQRHSIFRRKMVRSWLQISSTRIHQSRRRDALPRSAIYLLCSRYTFLMEQTGLGS